MSNIVLDIKGLNKYFGKTKVIDNVNMEVKSGEIFGFLGPNGAGKTTTIKMILGLLAKDSGTIKINDIDISKDFEKAMSYIGGIVENPDMYQYMSGFDNLKLYARIHNIKDDRINEVVKLVGLQDRISDKVSKYSLGMKQRLGLALTLLHLPKILILDEPTNGLDPAGIRELRDILKDLSHKQGISVLVSSHLLSEMELMCDRVAVINSGKIIKTGKIEDILANNTEDAKKAKYILSTENNGKVYEFLNKKYNDINIIINDNIEFEIEKRIVNDILKEILSLNVLINELYIKESSLEDAFLNITSGGEK